MASEKEIINTIETGNHRKLEAMFRHNMININTKIRNQDLFLYAIKQYLSYLEIEEEIIKLMPRDDSVDFIKMFKILIQHKPNVNIVDRNGLTPLMIACQTKQRPLIKLILDVPNLDVNIIDHNGLNAFMYSCINGLEEVALILSNQTNLDHLSQTNWTPLMFACHYKLPFVAKKIIASGQSLPNHVDQHGWSALMMACKYKLSEIAIRLVNTSGVDVNIVNDNGWTALMFASRNGLQNVVTELLKKTNIKIDITNKKGETALLLSCVGRFEQIALQLINTNQSNPNAINNNNLSALSVAITQQLDKVVDLLISVSDLTLGLPDLEKWTPLMHLCQNKKTKLALKLINTGKSNPDAIGTNNSTAITIASNKGIDDVTSLLIEITNLTLGHPDQKKQTPLIILCQQEKSELALKLIETGKSNPDAIDTGTLSAIQLASINNLDLVTSRLIEIADLTLGYQNYKKLTPLIALCTNNKADLAIKLIETGKSNPDAVTDRGFTALMIACNSKLVNVANKLLDTGITNIDQVNYDNWNVLLYAIHRNLPELAIRLIKTKKSKPDIVNNGGVTPLIMACDRNYPDIVSELLSTGMSNPTFVSTKLDATALSIACLRHLTGIGLEILKTEPLTAKFIDKNGNTPLIMACFENLSDLANELIKNKHSLSDHVNKNEETALMIACRNKLTKVALNLIKYGNSNLEYINSKKESALLFACRSGLFEIVMNLMNTFKYNIDYFRLVSLLKVAKDNLTESQFLEFETSYQNFLPNFQRSIRHQIEQEEKNEYLDIMFVDFIKGVEKKRQDPLFNQVYELCVSESELNPKNTKILINGVDNLITDFPYDTSDPEENNQNIQKLKSVIKIGNSCYTAEHLFDWWSSRVSSGREFTTPDSRDLVSDDKQKEIMNKYRNYMNDQGISTPHIAEIDLDPRYQLEFIPVPRRANEPFDYTRIIITDNGREYHIDNEPESQIFLGYIPVYNPPNTLWNSNAILALIRELWDRRLLLTNHTTDNLQCCRVHLGKHRNYWYRDTDALLESMHQEFSAMLS